MNATPKDPVDQTMANLEAIADRLQRGEITLEEADAESGLVRASLVRELKATSNGTVSAARASRLRMALASERTRRMSDAIFQPRNVPTSSFPRLDAIWSTLWLLCCVIGGLALLVRGLYLGTTVQDLGMTLQTILLSIFVMCGGVLGYSRYHPERRLRLQLKRIVSMIGLASLVAMIVLRKLGT